MRARAQTVIHNKTKQNKTALSFLHCFSSSPPLLPLSLSLLLFLVGGGDLRVGFSLARLQVTACIACNGKKKDLNPSQLRSVGMALARRPQQPTAYQLEAAARKFVYRSSIETPASRASVHASWEIYLAEILATTDAESPLAATAHSSD